MRDRIDAGADPGRRAWVPCPGCADHSACATCAQDRACEQHWRYLLAAQRRHLFVQCPGCRRRWWHDTGFGADDRPAQLDATPVLPPRTAA